MHRASHFLMLISFTLTIIAGLSQAADNIEQKFPDIIAATVQPRGPEVFDFDVTVSSPYDTPQRYADAIVVFGKDGTVYGKRKLLHDHADEQPFTRDLYDVKIPPGVKVVIVQGRDQQYGLGGRSIELAVPRR